MLLSSKRASLRDEFAATSDCGNQNDRKAVKDVETKDIAECVLRKTCSCAICNRIGSNEATGCKRRADSFRLADCSRFTEDQTHDATREQCWPEIRASRQVSFPPITVPCKLIFSIMDWDFWYGSEALFRRGYFEAAA